MSKELSNFDEVPGLDGVYTAHRGQLRCTAFRLVSGTLCLYSPVKGLSQKALQSIQAIGEVSHLLAPNHYHNTGLREYSETFPNAQICCSAAAKPRLEKQTGLALTTLEGVETFLPENTKLVEPRGLKTGEVWVETRLQNRLLLIVTDAFRGPTVRTGEMATFPELLGTFPRYAIENSATYVDWFGRYVENSTPTTIIPCHGSIISHPNLGNEAKALVETLRP